MDSTNPSFLLFTLSLILISNSPFLADADVKLITDVCKNSDDNAFCLNVLKADPQTSAAKTNCELAKFTLQLTIKKAQEVQDFLKGLLTTDKSPYLQSCAFNGYGAVIASYNSSLQELTEDVETANYDARVAGDGANECQNQLPPQGPHNTEISSRNKETVSFSSIAFAATLPLSENCH